MQFDLHSHSTASDGKLTPTELMHYAHEAGVTALALTDHDCVDGLEEAEQAASELEMHLISGIELSVTWHKHTIHIVGLNIDGANDELKAGIEKLRDFRLWRTEEIARRLDKAGIYGSLEGAKKFAKGNIVSRTHFANFLVEQGYAKSPQAVFKKYLVNNKPGFVPGQWTTLAEAVGWIKSAGGQAVIAHPGRYKMTNTKLRALIADFKACGGVALEVISGSHTPEQTQLMARYASDFELFASAGSDFHDPDFPWIRMGRLPPLPEQCQPIWAHW